jgi:hypothetical protein
LPGEHRHALAGIDLQGGDQLTIDFIKHGRADVWQGAAPLARIFGLCMLQTQSVDRLPAMMLKRRHGKTAPSRGFLRVYGESSAAREI